VMFVGGANTRTDFHIDQGSEFFYQLRGNMFLVIVERGKRRRIDIHDGDVRKQLPFNVTSLESHVH
jgi:3-hydroxyanthranilate 3,4-dioxygenase